MLTKNFPFFGSETNQNTKQHKTTEITT